MKRLAVAALVAACRARDPVTTCADSLAGEWRAEAGHTWALLDTDGSVEGYPTFADPPVPRALSLSRDGRGALAGGVTRRFEQGARTCTSRSPVHVLRCAADTLELVLGEPPTPVFGEGDRCITPQAATHRERWHRVR